MSVTSGFFNSLSGDRKYDAIQISSMFDGLITDGIYNGFLESFMVTASSPASMVVTVGEGRCWFNHTWTLNDAPLPLTLDVGDVVLNRIDTIVIDVDSTDTVRACTIKVVKGSPSSQAVRPTLENTETHHQYPLCDISVVAGATTVTQSNITNRRGTSDCPFVATLMTTVTVDELLVQWESQWNDWMTDRADAMDTWTAEQQEAFTTWFQTVQDTLDEDTAGNLYNLITNNTGINATATHAEGVVAITATGNPVNIVFLAPSNWAETDTYTYNGSPVELVDLLGEPVEDAWIEGSPVSLTITGGKAFFKNGGGRYKPTDLPPLNPNFTMEISEGDSEDTVTVTADKLTISPTTDMLAGGQWEYGTEMSPAPGKGQNIKHWTREQLVTSGKPFDGLLLGDVTASNAVNETILWLPENNAGNVELVPFVILSKEYLGGVAVIRKRGYGANGTGWGNSITGGYDGKTCDQWMENTYLNSILREDVASQIIAADWPTLLSSGSVGTLKRRAIALSTTELGNTASIGTAVEGTAFPYFSSNARRMAYADSGPATSYLTRSASTSFGQFFFVNMQGGINGATTSDVGNTGMLNRPAFILPKDFQIQQRPDGSYTIYNEYGLMTLGDVKASNTSTTSIVNVTESGQLAPFILLSQKYNEQDVSVIHRENLLPESWDSNYSGTTDYASSGIQTKFEEYAASTLDAPYRALLVSVEVTYKNLNPSDNWERKLSTKCCAIGAEELGIVSGWGLGNIFSYYELSENKKKKHDDGSYAQWYTRDIQSAFYSSNNRWYDRKPYFVSASGTTSGAPSIQHDLGLCPMLFFDPTAPIRLLADGSYDLVPEDPSLSAQTVSTLAEVQSDTLIPLRQVPTSTASSKVIVKVPENGTETNFIALRLGYGNVPNAYAMIREDTVNTTVAYNTSAIHALTAYNGSNLDPYLTGTYKTFFDETISSYLVDVPIDIGSTSTQINRSIFAVSAYEIGSNYEDRPLEGSTFPYFATVANRGSDKTYSTRSVQNDNSHFQIIVNSSGQASSNNQMQSFAPRPIICLDADGLVKANDDGTYTFVGVDDSSPTVSFSFTVPHGTQPVVRQYTYNYEEHYQTMLEGGVLPPLVDEGPTYSEILAENTWAQIAQAVADKDPILDVWQVGDTKDEVIAGETLTFAIMGKNMDDLADGSGKAGLTFGMTQLMASTRQMNSSNTNAGSFAGSAMYSWLSGTIYPNLPTELKDAIKAVNKKPSSGGGSSVIRTDAMYLWLFAEVEVFGSTTYSYAGEGTQYPYFATSAERIKRLSNGAGAASYWWERSPRTGSSTYFCRVSNSGSSNGGTDAAAQSPGVCFGFCI